MPRQVRIQYPGALYHVMARGDRREAIYRDDQDRRIFLDVFAAACGRTGWLCHAYVLMGNHYHLVLETPQPNLVPGMAWLQNTYTRRHNVRHHLWGHLFGGRYKAVLVDDEGGDYFATLIDYLHLNPVRAGLVGLEPGLETYPWSSLPSYLGPARARPAWLRVERGLGERGCGDDAAGRRNYLAYLEGRAATEGAQAGRTLPAEQSLQSTLRRGWIFGSEAFREKVLARAQTTLPSIVTWKRDSNADAYVVECCADPITPTGWKYMNTVKPPKFHGNGAVPGQACWYRVRGINGAGEGPWSEPALRPVM